ncbi:MAG: 3-phosphoshikimate 1-carboxyvinyltransferase, partial [Deltaproteobacteria bacterium]|nr:3-phosphoshikimate 1-carboxyvinyltransferase [Deltaproteobacteria bacterium]
MRSLIIIQAPASKSVSHRAMICAGLVPEGTSVIRKALASDDLERTAACLTALGANCSARDDGVMDLRGIAALPEKKAVLHVGESGTTCRLMTAVASAFSGQCLVTGDGRMHDRPIDDLIRPLEAMGVRIEYLAKPGCPPLAITSQGLSGGGIEVSLEQSSQYLSGLLLAAPLAAKPVRISVVGRKAVSWPYVALTVQTMADFGIPVLVEELLGGQWTPSDPAAVREVTPGRIRFSVQPGAYRARDYTVEGDWSNASYFLAAGAVGSGPVLVQGLRPDSLQGDRAMTDIVKALGGRVEFGTDGVLSFPARLIGTHLDMGHCPDLVPTVAALACFAQGRTTIVNVAHLRLKESDRLAAVATELSKTGARVEVQDDGLVIDPGFVPNPGPLALSTHDDHRMAMSLSLLEFGGFRPELDNPGCVAK